jgi:predicted Zn-dependent protease
VVAFSAPADAQLGGLRSAVKRAEQVRDLQISSSEERELGSLVSQKVRERYGVVQDAAVHRYVSLVGTAVAEAAGGSDLTWTFIVLDTDAVNAFAAPGGFVHITRGALALIGDESELAGVLGHEIVHVTEKHTIRAIQKNKSIQMGADETLSGNAALLNRLVENVYLDIVEKGFGRSEEMESDEEALEAANKLGYAPQGLPRFLTTLQERNKDSKEKRGLFASHPEIKDRLTRLTRQITSDKLTASATLADRYTKTIFYKPVALTEIALIEAGAAGLAGEGEKPADNKEAAKKEEPKKRGFGVGRLLPTGGNEKASAQASASGGPRLIDPERDAKGGGNPNPVPVKLTAADVTAFKKEGGLS